MARPQLVTADVFTQIQSWVDAGLSPTAIAEKIGCTLSTLRVRCAQFGISLRHKRAVSQQDAAMSTAECPKWTIGSSLVNLTSGPGNARSIR